MNEGLIPSRYAKALYKYAQEHHVAAPIYEEMKRLDAAFATHTELSKALSNPALSAADKVRVLSSAFGEKPDDYLLRSNADDLAAQRLPQRIILPLRVTDENIVLRGQRKKRDQLLG